MARSQGVHASGPYYIADKGGDGGGRIWIEARTLSVDGMITTDGSVGAGTAGAGSGGSVYVSCDVLTGIGTIRASGAAGGSGSGGGGGRVAVYSLDSSGFTGGIEAKGSLVNTNSSLRGLNGGAGTVYLKKRSDAYGTLIVDNGGTETLEWSTPMPVGGLLWLDALDITGGARVLSSNVMHVVSGDPSQFVSLIGSNLLQVLALWVDGRWAYGDAIDLAVENEGGQPRISVFSKPAEPFVLEVSTALPEWQPYLTNSPPNGRFEFLIEPSQSGAVQFFRAIRE